MGWQDTLEDYAQAMTPTQADRLLGVGTGTIAAAIRRGEIEPYRLPSAPTRPRVTPRMLAEWLERCCKGKEDAPRD